MYICMCINSNVCMCVHVYVCMYIRDMPHRHVAGGIRAVPRAPAPHPAAHASAHKQTGFENNIYIYMPPIQLPKPRPTNNQNN
jgi:hypothetical protein